MLEALNEACKEILKDKKQALIALTGLHGSGKLEKMDLKTLNLIKSL